MKGVSITIDIPNKSDVNSIARAYEIIEDCAPMDKVKLVCTPWDMASLRNRNHPTQMHIEFDDLTGEEVLTFLRSIFDKNNAVEMNTVFSSFKVEGEFGY